MNKQKDLNGNEASDVLIVTAPIKIDKGSHNGEITNVVSNLPNEAEGRPYHYIDVVVKLTDLEKPVELKCGFPANISELSTLGKLLMKAGMELIEDAEITIADIKELLVGQKITFLTNNEQTDAGEFARILKETIEFE